MEVQEKHSRSSSSRRPAWFRAIKYCSLGLGKVFFALVRGTVRLFVRFPLLLLVIIVAAGGWWLYNRFTSEGSLSLNTEKSILVTPEEIEEIKNIGKWEFLSYKTEEMVDTTEQHWYGNRELVRIYSGTLRIGIDLKKAEEGWFRVQGDTAFIRLPQPELLNPHFIDEARARTFYTKGTWDNAVQDALYEKAHRNMMKRGLNARQMEAARKQAQAQFINMAKGLGLRTVFVTFTSKK